MTILGILQLLCDIYIYLDSPELLPLECNVLSRDHWSQSGRHPAYYVPTLHLCYFINGHLR
jgi:hypothetical protein